MTVVRLEHTPRLGPVLLAGALRSPLKRPRPDAPLPGRSIALDAAQVDRGRLAAYAELCGFPADGRLPVTYPHVLAFPLAMRLMAARDFPLPLLGLVHTSIEIRQEAAPLRVEDRLELFVHAEKLTPHRRGTEATVVTRVRCAGRGDTAWMSRSTYLARHGKPGPATAGAPGAGTPDPLPVQATWRLPASLGRRYAAVSGDRNPIHLHPLTARAFGFPRQIAHGMWTAARCLAEQPFEGPVDVRVDFRAPVLLPGTVTYGGRTGPFELRGADGRLHLTGRVSGRV
ncbi:MaoC family dehydratase [Streptomyces indicus]|uniref:Acyl dehydratase n=1 Tax=Streptomyces indicus TaxID=417292 RepID=A0A1G9IAL6_9ACTN|nr:MaoC/PaaZ C-terminal domain-containing protein [Streptomyces indicus]SDL21873.1 Acyl dehydratase [Streptomyces indicus]